MRRILVLIQRMRLRLMLKFTKGRARLKRERAAALLRHARQLDGLAAGHREALRQSEQYPWTDQVTDEVIDQVQSGHATLSHFPNLPAMGFEASHFYALRRSCLILALFFLLIVLGLAVFCIRLVFLILPGVVMG